MILGTLLTTFIFVVFGVKLKGILGDVKVVVKGGGKVGGRGSGGRRGSGGDLEGGGKKAEENAPKLNFSQKFIKREVPEEVKVEDDSDHIISESVSTEISHSNVTEISEQETTQTTPSFFTSEDSTSSTTKRPTKTTTTIHKNSKKKSSPTFRLTIFLGISTLSSISISILIIVDSLTSLFDGTLIQSWLLRVFEPILLGIPLIFIGIGMAENKKGK